MVDRRRRIRAAGLAWLVLGGCLAFLMPGCAKDDYARTPEFERLVQLDEKHPGLEPTRLQILGDSLFVSFNGLPRLEVFDLDLNRLGAIDLVAPETILPTSFAVTDSQILVTDHGKGVVARFNRQGRYLDSFGTLPDGVTRLSPISVTCFAGMAYVADMKLKRVLAISLNDIEGITEVGEMVLSIPGENDPSIGFPSTVYVTADGRLLIGDAANGVVRVFTCDGRPIYEFDRVPDLKKMAPQSFAVDGIIDPSVQDEHSADPSGIRNQGRLHLVDGYNGKVHMFSPLGRFLGSYPKETRLTGPAGIAVDRVGKRIFVTDPPAGRILVYRYEGD
jgi:DNA-binding beta-propeller fold protein YncE